MLLFAVKSRASLKKSENYDNIILIKSPFKREVNENE